MRGLLYVWRDLCYGFGLLRQDQAETVAMLIVFVHVLATNYIELSVQCLDRLFIGWSVSKLVSLHDCLNGFDDLHLQYFNNALTVLNLMIDTFGVCMRTINSNSLKYFDELLHQLHVDILNAGLCSNGCIILRLGTSANTDLQVH